MKRQKQETWREYFARWETALRKVREHKVELPESYVGFLLINGLRLEEHEISSMLTVSHGVIQTKSIKAWLRKNESKLTANQLGAENTKKGTANAVFYAEDDEDDEPDTENDITEIEHYLHADTEGQEVPGAQPRIWREAPRLDAIGDLKIGTKDDDSRPKRSNSEPVVGFADKLVTGTENAHQR